MFGNQIIIQEASLTSVQPEQMQSNVHSTTLYIRSQAMYVAHA